MAAKTKSTTDQLDQLAALIAAELLGGGEYLHIITKKNKHTGTWHKSNLTNALSALLQKHIELI
jgi:hypothetical protein